jgi:hypothetical protein
VSVEQIEQSVMNLSLEDRRRFLDWLYENERQLAGPDYVHPEMLTPWEGTIDRARQRLNEIRD